MADYEEDDNMWEDNEAGNEANNYISRKIILQIARIFSELVLAIFINKSCHMTFRKLVANLLGLFLIF